jgi:ABC-type uncharacterized transport system ATPase component
MVVGLIKPDEGQVFLDTDEITKLPMYKRAQLGNRIPATGNPRVQETECGRQYHGRT